MDTSQARTYTPEVCHRPTIGESALQATGCCWKTGDAIEWRAGRALITRDVRRWLFHLRVTGHVPDHWERAFDRPQPWSFYWAPVWEETPLIGPQSDWLALMRPRLLDA